MVEIEGFRSAGGEDENLSARRKTWQWAADHTTAAVTLAGLATYVALRLPYSIYYVWLGTTPEEVGLSYVEILAQSVVGVVVIASAGLLVVLVLSFCIGFVATWIQGRATSRAWHRERDLIWHEYAQGNVPLDDAVAKVVQAWLHIRGKVMDIYRARYGVSTEEGIRIARSQERTFLLRHAGSDPAALEKAEAEFLDAPPARSLVRAVTVVGWRRLRWKLIGGTLIVMLLLVLPLLSLASANSVRDGNPGVLARWGLFGLRGDASCVQVDGEAVERVMFVGGGKDQVVVFAPDRNQTIRLFGATAIRTARLRGFDALDCDI